MVRYGVVMKVGGAEALLSRRTVQCHANRAVDHPSVCTAEQVQETEMSLNKVWYCAPTDCVCFSLLFFSRIALCIWGGDGGCRRERGKDIRILRRGVVVCNMGDTGGCDVLGLALGECWDFVLGADPRGVSVGVCTVLLRAGDYYWLSG